MRMRKSNVATRLMTPIAVALGVFVIGASDVSVTGADIYGVGGGSINFDCVNVFPIPPVFPLPPGAGAWIGGTVTRVTPLPNTFGFNPGDQLLFGVNDFGEPSGPIADRLDGFYGALGLCKGLAPDPFALMPIDQGNIVIKTG